MVINPGRAFLTLCLAGAAILWTDTHPPDSEAAPGRSMSPGRPHVAVNPLFTRLLPRLRATGVPLFLPTRAAMHIGYADLVTARPGYYLIYIGYIPKCDGATACDIGSLKGRHRPLTMPKPHGSPVRLARGFVGYFTPYTCGASCDESSLKWDYRGFRYTVGLKAGLRSQVVKVANSAINAGPA